MEKSAFLVLCTQSWFIFEGHVKGGNNTGYNVYSISIKLVSVLVVVMLAISPAVLSFAFPCFARDF